MPGLLAVRDEPRADRRYVVADLKAMGVRSIMLTGDDRRTADAIAVGLGVRVQAPSTAQASTGQPDEAIVPRCNGGNGINDTQALAAADVGIAMGGGTDVALEAADAALLKSRVIDVPHLASLSRATMANIHQNMTLALGLKGLVQVPRVMGITDQWGAVLVDTGAPRLVPLNALRQLRLKGSGPAPSSNSGSA